MLLPFVQIEDFGVVGAHDYPPVEGNREAWSFGCVELQNVQAIIKYLCLQFIDCPSPVLAV